MRRSPIIILFAALLLGFGLACEPADYDDPDTPSPTVDMTDDSADRTHDDTADYDTIDAQGDADQPEGVRGAIEDPATDERGWDRVEQGLQEMRNDVERQAEESGDDVDDALSDFDDRADAFRDDIRDTVDNLFHDDDSPETLPEEDPGDY